MKYNTTTVFSKQLTCLGLLTCSIVPSLYDDLFYNILAPPLLRSFAPSLLPHSRYFPIGVPSFSVVLPSLDFFSFNLLLV